ncbi:MAG: hypothetical protein IJ413_09805 [Bacteroides sp.]|nr:hypothetical protein [Bacteroides sp.]
MSSNGCLEEWYDLMVTHLNDPNTVWNSITPTNGTINLNHRNDALFECKHNLFSKSSSILPLFQYPNFGHDVPVWLEEDNNDNDSEDVIKIMIVSQDPLRDRGAIGKILFSSPFGVHCRDYRTQPRQCLMKIIGGVWKTAKANNKKVIFYLTDFNKFFLIDIKSSIKTLKRNHQGIVIFFEPTLKEEVRLFAPELIVTLGNIASGALLGKKGYIRSSNKNNTNGDFFNPKSTLKYGNSEVLICAHPTGGAGTQPIINRAKKSGEKDEDVYIRIIIEKLRNMNLIP